MQAGSPCLSLAQFSAFLTLQPSGESGAAASIFKDLNALFKNLNRKEEREKDSASWWCCIIRTCLIWQLTFHICTFPFSSHFWQRRIKSILHPTAKCVPSCKVSVVSLSASWVLVSVALSIWSVEVLVTLTTDCCRANKSHGRVRSCAAKQLSLELWNQTAWVLGQCPHWRELPILSVTRCPLAESRGTVYGACIAGLWEELGELIYVKCLVRQWHILAAQ